MATSTSKPSKGNWLQVQLLEDDIPPKLNTLSNCMTLCDVKCDNYIRLVAADIQLDVDKPSAVLKVFRGTDLDDEFPLNGIPSAIQSFYIDENEPKTPVVAVAISESILFYRHLKPYFKYTVPELEADEAEQDIWRKMPVMRTDQQAALIEELKTMDRPRLTRKSQKLIQITDAEERDKFIRAHAEVPMRRQPSIVALCCLQRLSSDVDPPAHLVIATDNGDIFILEAQSFGILQKAKTCSYPSTPSLMALHGTYETDYRIVVATRNGAVYLLRKADIEGQEIFKLNYSLTGLLLLPIDQTIVACSMEQKLVCYSKKGKQLYCINLEAMPVCMLAVGLPHLGLTLTCVSLTGGLVQFYMQRYLVDQFQIPNTVGALFFGRMGFEEHVLSLVTTEGDLFVKILRRVASFETQKASTSMASNQTSTNEVSILDKPKKSSIFVEQASREKQNAKVSYGSFQVELWRLRHAAARATIDVINSSESSISGDITHAPVKLSAEICGAGPVFRLYLIIQNLSTYKMASNLTILLHADRRHYIIPKSLAKLPSILPEIPLKIDFEVTAVLDDHDKLPPHTLTPENSHLRVMLMKGENAKPLIAAIVAMPQSEANLI